MCGILGSVGIQISQTVFEDALSRIAHRGPNDSGIYQDEGNRLFLGHRRLSIIDLSEGGHQPMKDNGGRYVVTYNGEIYNYIELREELRDQYSFRTESDTEVLLASYIVWGEDCVDHFNGMFAFAIWDTQEKILFAARDRVGEKPFFYIHRDAWFQFSSEIKALKAFGRLTPNQKIIDQYLYYGFYDHTDETFFEGVRSLAPGHILLFKNGQLTTRRYWDVQDGKGKYTYGSDEEVREKLRELVSDSLRLRFRSDVPVGINLSSGLDSGVLFAKAREMYGDTINAFSMCSQDRAYDECSLIKEETLDGYNKDLWHTSTLTAEECMKRAQQLNKIEDQPYGGIPTIAYEKLSEVAVKKQVTVLLEGQGVDELLGGYRYYRIELLRDLWKQHRYLALFEYLRRQKVGNWFKNMKEILKARELRSHDYSQDATKLIDHRLLSSELKDRARNNPPVFEAPFNSHLLNAQYRDLRYAKLPRVLRFNDHATMAHARELRLPYLDHRLIEFCFFLPHRFKISYNSQKVLMRKAFLEYLKPSHRTRQKIAFGAQQTPWLRKHGKEFVYDLINSSSFKNRPYWDHKALKESVDQFFKGEGDNSFFLWQCINLELWFREHIDVV